MTGRASLASQAQSKLVSDSTSSGDFARQGRAWGVAGRLDRSHQDSGDIVLTVTLRRSSCVHTLHEQQKREALDAWRSVVGAIGAARAATEATARAQLNLQCAREALRAARTACARYRKTLSGA